MLEDTNSLDGAQLCLQSDGIPLPSVLLSWNSKWKNVYWNQHVSVPVSCYIYVRYHGLLGILQTDKVDGPVASFLR